MKKKIADEATTRETLEAVWNLLTERVEPDGWRAAEQRGVRLASSDVVRTETMRVARMKSAQTLRELRKKGANIGRNLPAPKRWESFYRAQVLPAINKLSGRWGRCEECGDVFLRTRQDRRYCTDGCNARVRMRGRKGSPPARDGSWLPQQNALTSKSRSSKSGGYRRGATVQSDSDRLSRIAEYLSEKIGNRLSGEGLKNLLDTIDEADKATR